MTRTISRELIEQITQERIEWLLVKSSADFAQFMAANRLDVQQGELLVEANHKISTPIVGITSCLTLGRNNIALKRLDEEITLMKDLAANAIPEASDIIRNFIRDKYAKHLIFLESVLERVRPEIDKIDLFSGISVLNP